MPRAMRASPKCPPRRIERRDTGRRRGRRSRVRAIETLLELLAIAKRSAAKTEPRRQIGDWSGLRSGAKDMRDAFTGLFAADELSFVQLFSDLLERAGDEPDKASRVELSAQADRLASVFGERLAELRRPAAEMLAAAALFDERAAGTGRASRALADGQGGSGYEGRPLLHRDIQ